MKMMVLMVGAALALSACADSNVAGPVAPQYAKGGPSAGGSGVVATVYVGGRIEFRESGAANTGVGACEAGGRWNNTAGGYVTAAMHPNCASVVGGTAVQVTIGGRVNGTTLRDTGWWLTYHQGRDETVGSGSATVRGSDGKTWFLYMPQGLLNGRGNFMSSAGTVAELCSDGCHPGKLSW